METKKSNQADLEKKRGLFLQIGLVITLAILLMAFEWSTYRKIIIIPENTTTSEVEEFVINTFRNEEPLERPKPEINITEILKIVDDETDSIDDILAFDVTDDQKTKNNYKVTFDPEPEDDLRLFIIVEDMPIFRPEKNKTKEEADIDLHRYVASQVEYPEMAVTNNIEGRIYVNFVVDRSGKVRDVNVARKTDPLLDEEAIRVVSSLPAFKPGMQRGKPVNVSYSVSINFKLK